MNVPIRYAAHYAFTTVLLFRTIDDSMLQWLPHFNYERVENIMTESGGYIKMMESSVRDGDSSQSVSNPLETKLFSRRCLSCARRCAATGVAVTAQS